MQATESNDNPFTAIKTILLMNIGKRVKMICQSGAFICCRIAYTDWPHITAKEAYLEYDGLTLYEPWALIHIDEIRILTPAKEIADEEIETVEPKAPATC